jgi:hypothetical protein
VLIWHRWFDVTTYRRSGLGNALKQQLSLVPGYLKTSFFR